MIIGILAYNNSFPNQPFTPLVIKLILYSSKNDPTYIVCKGSVLCIKRVCGIFFQIMGSFYSPFWYIHNVQQFDEAKMRWMNKGTEKLPAKNIQSRYQQQDSSYKAGTVLVWAEGISMPDRQKKSLFLWDTWNWRISLLLCHLNERPTARRTSQLLTKQRERGKARSMSPMSMKLATTSDNWHAKATI